MNNKSVSDIEKRIVALLEERKKEAISLIYDNYSAALFGLIIRIVNTHENAEEVLQNVLLKVWSNANTYDASKGRLYTWLVNIARNSAIDYTRSAKYKAGKKAVFGFFVGQVMRETRGQADPEFVNELLQKSLS